MAAVMDDDEMAKRQVGQREDECNNQIVVDCVRGERALNNTMSGAYPQNIVLPVKIIAKYLAIKINCWLLWQ